MSRQGVADKIYQNGISLSQSDKLFINVFSQSAVVVWSIGGGNSAELGQMVGIKLLSNPL